MILMMNMMKTTVMTTMMNGIKITMMMTMMIVTGMFVIVSAIVKMMLMME